MRRPAAPYPVLLTLPLALGGCTGESSPPGDPSACAGRVDPATLDRHFPGYDGTDGGFMTNEPNDPGGCAIRRDDVRLASVAVFLVPDEEQRRSNLERDLDALAESTSAPPQPTDLGPDVVLSASQEQKTAGLMMLMGQYQILILIDETDSADAAAEAAVAIARDVKAYYTANPPPGD